MVPTNAERTDRSRRAILDAARPVFARSGYAAASLNKIIEDSGLTKGGFYFHFASKQALALAVLADQQQQLRESVAAEIGQYPRAVDRLFAAPRALARATVGGHGPTELSRMIGELAQNPDLRDEVCGSIEVWIGAVAEQFRDAQQEGTIRGDLDAAMLAQIAVGGFTGMHTLTEQLADDGLERRVEALITIVQIATSPIEPGAPARRTARRGST
jgi:AcrR family transcriptional regulator